MRKGKRYEQHTHTTWAGSEESRGEAGGLRGRRKKKQRESGCCFFFCRSVSLCPLLFVPVNGGREETTHAQRSQNKGPAAVMRVTQEGAKQAYARVLRAREGDRGRSKKQKGEERGNISRGCGVNAVVRGSDSARQRRVEGIV